jgi:predicted oxidoreductase
MATVTGPHLTKLTGIVLGTSQTGNVDTADTLDRGSHRGPAAIIVTNVDGGSGTVKLDIKGSVDGTNFYNIPYALVATPSTFVVTQLTITTAATTTYLLQTDQAWRYIKGVYSSNTAETMTLTAYL